MKTSRSPRHAFCDARRSKKPLEREVIEGVRWKEEASVRDLDSSSDDADEAEVALLLGQHARAPNTCTLVPLA